MKLTDEDKKILLDWGYTENDLEQIQRALVKTTYELYSDDNREKRKISGKQARELLGQEKFLSGISRSAFHYTSLRETSDGKEIIFDTYKLFDEKKKSEEVEENEI